jgi:hypothetical protein
MTLPPDMHPGMVAWTLGANGTAATPACMLGVEKRHEGGAFSPFVRVRLPWPVPAFHASCVRCT